LNLNDALSAQQQNKWAKLHIMQIAIKNLHQKRQIIECSGHTGGFYHPHYISFGPLQNFTMKVELSYRKYTLFSRCLWLKVHIANLDSNLVALHIWILASSRWQSIWAFNDDVIVQKNEIEIKGLQQLLRFSWFKPEEALKGNSMAVQNRCRWFEQRNVFGLCWWLKVLYWSGKMKRDSNVVGGCDWETLSWCSTIQHHDKRRASSEIDVANSRGGTFTSFAQV
jgi:hypothetical protein